MKIGLGIGGGLAPAHTVAIAHEADAAGIDSFWLTEGAAGDAFAVLSAASTVTTRIRLGTAVVNVHTRSLPLIAMAAATVADLAPGRFTLGLGAGHAEQVSGEHGLPFERPIAKLLDAIEVVRAVQQTGRLAAKDLRTTRIDAFRLTFPPPPAAPIYVAVGGPRTARIAADFADGALFVWRSPDDIAALRTTALTAKPAALLLHVAVGDDPSACEAALVAARTRHSAFGRYRVLFDTQRTRPGIVCIRMGDLVDAVQQYDDAGLNELILLPIATSGDLAEAAATRLVRLFVAARSSGAL